MAFIGGQQPLEGGICRSKQKLCDDVMLWQKWLMAKSTCIAHDGVAKMENCF